MADVSKRKQGKKVVGIMDLIKKYKIVIAIVLTVLILVLIRALNPNHFKTDAGKWAEPSVLKSNTISVEQSVKLPGDKLIIYLDKEGLKDLEGTAKSLDIPAESILNKENIRIIKDHNGPVLLYSTQLSVTARIWMLLSQMGCTNLYILNKEPDNEVLKYKFRSDTLVRPEF